MAERLENGLQLCRFAVDSRAWCVWGTDLEEENTTFLKGLDPAYFDYLARTHGAALEGDSPQMAALALRIGYSHGLEALFALLGATIQAPDSVVAWLQLYRNDELTSIVRKVSECKAIPSKLVLPTTSWNAVASAVHQPIAGDEEKREGIARGFGQLWQRMAQDFLDAQFTHEYNSIKHGLRVRPGGFGLSVGMQESFGTPAKPEAMKPLGKGKFGSSFYFTESILKRRSHLRLRHSSRNWEPVNLAHGLALISMSMANTNSFLQLLNGENPETLSFAWPDDLRAFEEPWLRSPGPIKFELGARIEENHIVDLSDEEILSVYETSTSRG